MKNNIANSDPFEFPAELMNELEKIIEKYRYEVEDQLARSGKYTRPNIVFRIDRVNHIKGVDILTCKVAVLLDGHLCKSYAYMFEPRKSKKNNEK